MALQVKFYKVSTLPVTPVADAVYFVWDGVSDYADTWVTDNSGNLRQVGNVAMIDDRVSTIDGGTF